MFPRILNLCCILLVAALAVAQPAPLSSRQQVASPDAAVPLTTPWISQTVQHAYGLPDTKPKAKGTIQIDKVGLTFTGKSSRYTIPWTQTRLVSNGTERVEMWGTTGRIVRMAIPDGGGLAAAGLMHHKVSELTVDFNDTRGAYHGAVFYLTAADAAHILDFYARALHPARSAAPVVQSSDAVAADSCSDHPAPKSVLVLMPSWNQTEVPAAYRAMVYEHIVDRVQRVEGVGHVYRDGEASTACPQYTVAVSIVSFKPGNQVKRAMMGPVGFFAGTTQMVFKTTIRDASGRLEVSKEIKASVRGEGESKNITDGAAKKIAKTYANTTKDFEKNAPAVGAMGTPTQQANIGSSH